MAELISKYHLPHNAIVVDEFNFMLNSIDLEKDYYFYEDLRMLFLKKEIEENKLSVFHKTYHNNFLNHKYLSIRTLYSNCINNPTEKNLQKLLNCQYTDKKTFKQVFNETVRDYTEFFAFLGLLPTYYKGKAGGEKKHFVSERLKDYRNGNLSLEQLIFDFKYRNSSKDYDVLDMYQISVRPYVVALKACKHYFDLGFTHIDNKIISAIVLYAKDENESNLKKLYNLFPLPTMSIDTYKNNFNPSEFESIKKELGRATLQLKPYLESIGYLKNEKGFYVEGNKKINESLWTKKVAFCNSNIGNLSVTPVVGKILYKLYKCSIMKVDSIVLDDLFDSNVSDADKDFLIDELKRFGSIKSVNNNLVKVGELKDQISINPYCDFFEITDSNYVSDIGSMRLYNEPLFIQNQNAEMERLLSSIKPIALGSNGTLYEETMYKLLKDNFSSFDTKWYGANTTGQRLSDIFIRTTVRDGNDNKNIVIIIECKAGNAVRAFDERKEIDDITNTLAKEKSANKPIDGVWYWVVNGDSLPSIDEHGGYRENGLSLSFIQKLGSIQFNISEMMRVPTIVTAFSFDAIKNYISYLYDKIGTQQVNVINRIDVPHFWRWSKKFMNLQYVMVHKELRLNA